jgi:hypothetical protein
MISTASCSHLSSIFLPYFTVLGFLSYIKNYAVEENKAEIKKEISNNNRGVGGGVVEKFDKKENTAVEEIFSENNGNSEISVVSGIKEDIKEDQKLPLTELFQKGSDISAKTWQEMVTRQAKIEEKEDDLSKPPTKFLINLKAGGLSGGIDIFEGPPIYGENGETVPVNSILGQINKKIKEENLVAPDLKNLEIDERNLLVLMTELNRTDHMMHESILDSYRDFLLCDNFLYLMKEANTSNIHPYETRLLFSTMTKKVIRLPCYVMLC